MFGATHLFSWSFGGLGKPGGFVIELVKRGPPIGATHLFSWSFGGFGKSGGSVNELAEREVGDKLGKLLVDAFGCIK